MKLYELKQADKQKDDLVYYDLTFQLTKLMCQICTTASLSRFNLCHVQIYGVSGLHDFHMSLIAQNTTDNDEEDGRMTMVGLLIEVRTPFAVSGLPE